jgi:branched-chain amino acid transport system substrate-binding protein
MVGHLADRNIRRVALVYDRATIISRYVKWFDIYADKAGIDTVARRPIIPNIEDAKTVIDALGRSDPTAIVYFGLGPSAQAIATALRAAHWELPVVGNSALISARGRPELALACDAWVYVDMLADTNPMLDQAAQRLAPHLLKSPIGVCFYDMGRLVGQALGRAPYLTRIGVRDGFEQVKRLPASVGHAGTTMTIGHWDRAILKGQYLVLRQWRNGSTLEYPNGTLR